MFYFISVVHARDYSRALMNFDYVDAPVMERINYNYAYARQMQEHCCRELSMLYIDYDVNSAIMRN